MKAFEGLRGDFFELREVKGGACSTRRNSHAFVKKRFKLDVAKYSFSNRVVDEWNGLPSKVNEEKTLDAFKGNLDFHLKHVRD